MLIDEALITVYAGHGGDGLVTFFMGRGKPSGGDGGKGGCVYATVSPQLTSLLKYVKTPNYHAKDGESGGSFTKTGHNADDLILGFPTGTQLIDSQSGEVINLQPGENVLLCKGGAGGWGNSRISLRQQGVFDKANDGKQGDRRSFKVIMRLIADCGLIGLPNAGKSSLLNVLTKADAKVASYPFTTLEPNLGVLAVKGIKPGAGRSISDAIIIADIPGLIEGASSGKGLGVKFLKHVEKVNVLLHCISLETKDILADYQKVHEELREYNVGLLNKKEIILLTKSDLFIEDKDHINKQETVAKSICKDVMVVSAIDDESIFALAKQIDKLVKPNK